VTEPVILERRGAVQWIIINREERRNALNERVASGIRAGLDAAEADKSVRAVVLTGAGDKAFCAGGDLQLQADGTPFTIDAADPRHYVAGC
jgi:enoyl-CoA hydratase/carnithine racemase